MLVIFVRTRTTMEISNIAINCFLCYPWQLNYQLITNLITNLINYQLNYQLPTVPSYNDIIITV